MAKYESQRNARCGRCGNLAQVTIDTIEADTSYSDRGTTYTPREQLITVICECTYRGNPAFQFNPKAKETPVAKQFDTTEAKSIALNSIVSKVEAVERALFNKSHALAKAEAEHNRLIADASNALNHVLAESLQSSITEDDFEEFLPDYDEELSNRLNEVRNIMSLANVLEGV